GGRSVSERCRINLSRSVASDPHDCVGVAAARTREYLAFADPENKFQPSPSALREIFLMTYLQRSSQLHLADTLTCTAMTPEQRVLLGADWVWAVLDLPSRNPKIQIAVQVLHVLQEPEANTTRSDAHVEILHMASTATVERTRAERLVGFCSAVGWSCFALFLFFGFGSDPGNICGLTSSSTLVGFAFCPESYVIQHLSLTAKPFVMGSKPLFKMTISFKFDLVEVRCRLRK
uniref:Uncharacterized protein n=1 Tax=Electrophorus electricus TaxID=8005 RepID=A0A4W4FWT1_ELEEL